MDIRQAAVSETAFLHLRDASDALMYEGDDETKPVGITLYGPGSKSYARANHAKMTRLTQRAHKKGGRGDLSQEDSAVEVAQYLADVTKEFHYIERTGPQGEALTGESLFKAVYGDRELGFIADQAARFTQDWSNFSKGSAKT